MCVQNPFWQAWSHICLHVAEFRVLSGNSKQYVYWVFEFQVPLTYGYTSDATIWISLYDDIVEFISQ